MKIGTFPKIGERVEVASRYVSKCKKLLDVGCGNGEIFRFIKSKVSKTYGIDSSKESIIIASKVGLIAKIVDLDFQRITFKNNYFDIVTCLDVIEHIKDPEKLLFEIHRVLKKRGKLVLSFPNIRFFNHITDLVIKGKFPLTSIDKTKYDGGHIHYFTFLNIKMMLEKHRFNILHEEGIINKPTRGIKGRILEKIFGKKIMREFFSPGILIVSKKN
jgi:methionine biosynthesis protein MetW